MKRKMRIYQGYPLVKSTEMTWTLKQLIDLCNICRLFWTTERHLQWTQPHVHITLCMTSSIDQLL